MSFFFSNKTIIIFSLELIHKKFSHITPCVLILNNGSDPTTDLVKLAEKNDITGPTFKVLSLGTCEESVSSNFHQCIFLSINKQLCSF